MQKNNFKSKFSFILLASGVVVIGGESWAFTITTKCYIGVSRSRKIESDRDYQKNKEHVQELKVLGKKEKLHSTINKYIETFDINTITSF